MAEFADKLNANLPSALKARITEPERDYKLLMASHDKTTQEAGELLIDNSRLHDRITELEAAVKVLEAVHRTKRTFGETMKRLEGEAVTLRADNERLKAELAQARAELEQDKLLDRVAEVEDAHKRAANSKLVFKEAKP